MDNNKPKFLCNAADGFDADMKISLLESSGIPVMKKYPKSGGYLKVYTGGSFYGVDIYVPENRYVEAWELININAEIDTLPEDEFNDSDIYKDIKHKNSLIYLYVFSAILVVIALLFSIIQNSRG